MVEVDRRERGSPHFVENDTYYYLDSRCSTCTQCQIRTKKARDEVDECGVSITSTYALLLAKPRQKHVRNVLGKCYR